MKLEVKNIHKSFGDNEVLHGISFNVTSGNALGLLGRNGAGKTTTIRILMDVFKANKGEILIDGIKFDPTKYKIGYLPEERGLYPKKKIIDQLMYLGQLRGLSIKESKTNARKWLKKLQVSEYENRLLETLSKGNQQKVQLAQTLICDPDIVILDEPFSGLDPVNSQILKDTVEDLINSGKLVIFSSHQMNYVEEFCKDIAIINHGNIVLDGNLKDIKKSFGDKKLIISATNYSLEQLKNIFESKLKDYVSIENMTKDTLVLSLINNHSKKDLLNEINKTDIDIEHFGNYEPSLNDIFILKAGEN